MRVPFLNYGQQHFGTVVFSQIPSSSPTYFFEKSPSYKNCIASVVVDLPHLVPSVINGKIATKRVINMYVVMNHMFGDGSDAAKFLRAMRLMYANPQDYFKGS